MLHRTNEAMNGLSHRLDEIIVQAEKNGRAQGRQQWAMIALTAVLALATIVYTVTTDYATRETVKAQQASTASQVRVEYVRGSGAVPESAAVHMGLTKKGIRQFVSTGLRMTFLRLAMRASSIVLNHHGRTGRLCPSCVARIDRKTLERI
ncbi:hypothetical protein RI103_35165 [Paraburkholderia sp. FT54]|uniref:hypothetical protein n=1 Tax=Paraburkholderia sp. FT54 TaxID=3074437 RepID=UPI0028772ACE|nr:hypothetical protein [Paraburkholderia sp. FT54]WNC94409.1 hypothetical protein RI103_35165 [Paraburkholderia sp. FT54]